MTHLNSPPLRRSRQAGLSLFASLAVFASVLPHTALALSTEDSRHLQLRTGFAITDAQTQSLAPLSYDAAVDQLVNTAARHTQAQTPVPEWTNEPLPRLRELKNASPEEKKAFVQNVRKQSVELQGWWMQEMVNTPVPLTERMTLFWHNHFTSGVQKVKSPTLMYRQNVTLRRYALGNFKTMLHAIAHDPAMIVYLDNVSNRDTQPNENFARELMELFTLGIGHYTENDIKESARAFTGWALMPETGEFREVRRWHDDGSKTFMGHTGNLDGDDVIDIILAQPQTATYIVECLWREFVSPNPDPQQVQQLATNFRRNYELAPLMSALLKTPQFRSREDDGVLVKSPVELVVGTLREFNIQLDEGPCPGCFPAIVADRLGQQLFNPPNVRGWPGGNDWINSQTLVGREQFMESVTRGFDPGSLGMGKGNPRKEGESPQVSKMMKAAAHLDAGAETPEDGANMPADAEANPRARLMAMIRQAAQNLNMDQALGRFAQAHTTPQAQNLLVAIAPVTPLPSDTDPADAVRSLLLDPVYQLK